MDGVNQKSILFPKAFDTSVLGFFLTIALATCAVGQTPDSESPLADLPVFGAPATPSEVTEGPQNQGQSGITCQILPNPQGHYTAFVFDSVRGVLAVYLVDSGTGQINLKSVRQVSWDLRMEEFNTNQPSPSDIRDSQR